jgi:hypothetical protein
MWWQVYNGLAAGCLPIYYGAPDIKDFVPDINGLIDYSEFGSPEALVEELERLSSDHVAYNAKLAWRERPKTTWSTGFRKLMKVAEGGPTECQVCQRVVARRIEALATVPST